MKKKNLVTDENETLAMKNKFAMLGSGLGIAGMLYYSFKVKSGFWKGLGFVLLGSLGGAAVGGGIDAVYLKK